MLVIAGVVAYFITRSNSSATTTSVATTIVARGPIIEQVAGSGSIAAIQTLNLAFQSNGTVSKVAVKEGDSVTAGQILAQLDTRDLELSVAIAQVQLESAKAKLAQTRDGDILPSEISAQQAMITSAEAQYMQPLKAIGISSRKPARILRIQKTPTQAAKLLRIN